MSEASNKYNSLVKELDALKLTDLPLNKAKVDQCINEVFNSGNKRLYCSLITGFSSVMRFMGNILRISLTWLFIIVFIYLYVVSHNTIQKFVMRNSQSYIYPIMRSLRILTLPLLEEYEVLSDWHEEECLIRNPIYYETPLDCWPCEDIRTLVDLTDLNNYSSAYVYNEQPFIVRDSIKSLFSFEDLKKLYEKYSLTLDRGTAKFSCSEKNFCSPRDILTKASVVKKDSFHVSCFSSPF